MEDKIMQVEINDVSLRKVGDSYYILIPAYFIKHGLINPEENYEIEIYKKTKKGWLK